MNTGLEKKASALSWLGCPYLPEYIEQFGVKAKFYFEFVVNNVYILSYLCEVSWNMLAWQLETEEVSVSRSAPWFAYKPPAGPAWLLLGTA